MSRIEIISCREDANNHYQVVTPSPIFWQRRRVTIVDSLGRDRHVSTMNINRVGSFLVAVSTIKLINDVLMFSPQYEVNHNQKVGKINETLAGFRGPHSFNNVVVCGAWLVWVGKELICSPYNILPALRSLLQTI